MLKVEQKVADVASENALVAQRIKSKLLRKLEKEIDSLPESIGSETKNSLVEKSHEKGKTKVKEATKSYKLRDLASAYRDLTDGMNLNTSAEQVRIIIDV